MLNYGFIIQFVREGTHFKFKSVPYTEQYGVFSEFLKVFLDIFAKIKN